MNTPSRFPAALEHVRHQSTYGPAFDVGLCKQRTRLAYFVPSNGSKSAAEAFTHTRHRLPDNAPWLPGALRWYTGGAHGYGHVTIDDQKPGMTWTVDYPRAGYWNRVSVAELERVWPNIVPAGRSLDIDGVQVIPDPQPKPAPATPVIDHAIDDLETAIAGRKPGPVRRALRAARQAAIAARRAAKGRG